MRQMLPHIWDVIVFPKKHDTHPRVNRVVKGITKSFFRPFFSHFIGEQLSFTEAACGYGGFVWFIKFSWIFSLKSTTLNHAFVEADVRTFSSFFFTPCLHKVPFDFFFFLRRVWGGWLLGGICTLTDCCTINKHPWEMHCSNLSENAEQL